jgi:hypothetical protein
MYVLAHLGKIPIEESLPFLVPVVALYLWGRHQLRRTREAVKRLPKVDELDDGTVSRLLDRWSARDHGEVSLEHLPLLYPPGPDGMTTAELAARIHSDARAVARLLEDLANLGYVELETPQALDHTRAWLTAEGYDLVNITEDVLLAGLPRASARGTDAN